MVQQNTRLRNVGFITFFFSGICAISSGVVVSLLQEQYGFAYGMTGTLLSLMSIGNLLAGFLIAMLPGKLGMKPSILLLTIGYALGYAMMGLSGAVAVLALGFFLVGIAKGSVINTCTILVSDNSALAGVYGDSLCGQGRGQEGSHRLELPQIHPLLAVDRPALLPERR